MYPVNIRVAMVRATAKESAFPHHCSFMNTQPFFSDFAISALGFVLSQDPRQDPAFTHVVVSVTSSGV